jgi:hypothetical protein
LEGKYGFSEKYFNPKPSTIQPYLSIRKPRKFDADGQDFFPLRKKKKKTVLKNGGYKNLEL